jgi:hypothetical protein
MLWNAVENYSYGKLLKTKDERESDYSNQKESHRKTQQVGSRRR